MVKDLPHPYVFTLLPFKAKDCPHPRCQDNGNSEDGNTWFPGGPLLSYFPIPIADPNALGRALANSVETNALITIFVQKSITTFTRPMEDKG